MHLFFSAIGGAGISSLALVAHQAGFEVSGSDKRDSAYIDYLKANGINNITIGQTEKQIAAINDKRPIDWYIYSSAVTIENKDPEELRFCKANGIKTSKRDDFINYLLDEKKLKLIAIAGTQGKSTTTAMVIWLFKQLGVKVSYSIGAKLSFGLSGEYVSGSEYFVYEADEFDRNFLSFEPYVSVITGVSWDHHEIFPTREDYQQAFSEFVDQSKKVIIWEEDFDYLSLPSKDDIVSLSSADQKIDQIKLLGKYNRLNAYVAVELLHSLSDKPVDELISTINKFSGLERRMEEIQPNLFTDYAHTPEKIRGAMSVALEMSAKNNQDVIVVYEGLTNRRQHHMIDDYGDCFDGAKRVYWVPSYLAREDLNLPIIQPEELISHLTDPSIATPAKLDDRLKNSIENHLRSGDMVIAMSGGGGGSLDEWLRSTFKE